MRRLRRALTAASAAAAAWSLAITLTGGIVLEPGGVTITSRNPRNPLIAAVILALIAFALPMPNRRQVMAGWLRRGAACLREHRTSAWWEAPAWVAAAAAILLELRAWAFARPLWLDEQLIALNVRDRTFAELAGPLWFGQSAPYGWLAVERAAFLALGSDERALRLPPLLFGCAMVALALWTGRRWLGPAGAFVLVILCGFGHWLSHYPLELKHYSADAFFGLLLPVMALSALAASEDRGWRRRATAWWIAASAGVWLSYGAIFVAPACALVLMRSAFGRGQSRGVVRQLPLAIMYLASFGLHYAVSLRHTAGSAYLQGYWASAFPPEGAGIVEAIGWAWQQLVPLALIPGGTAWGILFWMAACAGFAALGGRAGLLLASVPLSAFVFSIARLAPMQDRLALWIVPVLYLGVALLADWSVRLGRQAFGGRPPPHFSGWRRGASAAAALVAAVIAVVVSADVVSRGWYEFRAGRLPGSNHGLDDRSAAAWLLDERQAGDVIVSTRLGVPAFWWYGAVPMGGDAEPGGRLSDGTPVVVAGRGDPAGGCGPEELRAFVAGQRRVLFYSGFPDEPEGFDDSLLRALTADGAVVAEQRFAEASRAVVVQLDRSSGRSLSAANGGAASAQGPGQGQGQAKGPPGSTDCVIGRAAHRW